MKTLWVNSNFMHPTTKGGQIRTLEMLRHLHRWHEIHYVAIENPAQPEGPARAQEYSHRSYPFPYRVRSKTSPAFYATARKPVSLPCLLHRPRRPNVGGMYLSEGFEGGYRSAVPSRVRQ